MSTRAAASMTGGTLATVFVLALLSSGPLDAKQTTGDQSELEEALLDHLDQSRERLGSPALSRHPALEQAVRERAGELAGRTELDSSSAEVTRLERRLWQLKYRPHFWREVAVAGDLDVSMVRRTHLGPELLRQHLEHSAVACAPRERGDSLCLILVAERKIAYELRVAEPLRDLERVRSELLQEVNRLRTAAGVGLLAVHDGANRAAQSHAEAMLEQDYYSHQAPDGSKPRHRAKAAGFTPRSIAENIAKVVTTPEDAVARWMSSSGHRRNLLLGRATHHGLGVAVGLQDGEVVALWCQLIVSP